MAPPKPVVARTRGMAIPRDSSIDNVRVLRATVGYNAFISPPPPAPPVLTPLAREYDAAAGRFKKVDPIRTGQAQGVTDAGQSYAPPAHAKPGAQPPVAGSGSKDWVVPTTMGVVPEVDKNGVRVESHADTNQPPLGGNGGGQVKPEEPEDVATGIYEVGQLPAGAILLRAVVEEVTAFEGDTASLEVGTRDEPSKFLSISGEEALPGGKDLGVPGDDFLLEPVDVVVTVKAGEDVKKFTNGSFSFVIFYLASLAKGKPAEDAAEADKKAKEEAEAKANESPEDRAEREEQERQDADDLREREREKAEQNRDDQPRA